MLMVVLVLAAGTFGVSDGANAERIVAQSLTRTFRQCMVKSSGEGSELSCWRDELTRQQRLLRKTYGSIEMGSSASNAEQQEAWTRRQTLTCRRKPGTTAAECQVEATILRIHSLLRRSNKR